jgi:hypothetical protein
VIPLLLAALLAVPAHAQNEALGDFSAAKGDADNARGYYEQALARNGYEPRVRRKIEKLGADE